YVDLATRYGYTAVPGLAGDTISWSYSEQAGTDFYGVTQNNSPLLTDDGIVLFAEYGGTPHLNQKLPDANQPNGLYAAYWRDMEIVYDAAANRGVTAVTFGNNQLWLVEFDDLQAYNNPTTTLDMEIMVWRASNPTAGSYDLYYAFDNVHVADTVGTIGVEDPTGTVATQFAYNDFTPTDGLVICLDYVGPTPTVLRFDAVVDAFAAAQDVVNVVSHQTDNPGSKTATAEAALHIESSAHLFISASTSGTVDNLRYRDEDILAYNLATGRWSMLFDGSDVGLGSNDINALHVADNGTIYLSVASTSRMYRPPGYVGPGTLYNTNIYAFVPTTLGWETAGTFELIFDGSDVGLDRNTENIDALALGEDGSIVISTLGTATVRGHNGAPLWAKDQDLLLFTPTTLGEETTGSWQLRFDGTAAGLREPDEDIWGVWLNQDALYLTTRGDFVVDGLRGGGGDILLCDAAPCAFTKALEGSAIGLAHERIDGFSFGPLPALVTAARAVPSNEEMTDEANDEIGDDLLDDNDSALEIRSYLPLVVH
ncbi:MAG: hypothetical protein KDE58_15195, partial [Caldilineaceae bacterium]|nr:hypothetical protein [Caldilineaceae bacterium]